MERLAPKPELLAGSSVEIARQVENRVRELLGRHADLVGPVLVDLIAQRESQSALQEYGKRRLEGHANDNWSHQPGITVYVTPEAKELMVKVFKREAYPVTEDQIEPVNPNMWAFRFPRGVYSMGMGGCQLYLEAAKDWYKSNKAEKPFVLGYDDILRVEGDSNELWQNWNYQWDGNPRN